MAPATTAVLDETEVIKGYLIEIGQWRTEFGPVVGELVELRRLRADAIARGQESPTVKGSRGQFRENPALSTVLKLQDQCNKLAAALLLTPAAAARAGVKQDADPLDSLLGD